MVGDIVRPIGVIGSGTPRAGNKKVDRVSRLDDPKGRNLGGREDGLGKVEDAELFYLSNHVLRNVLASRHGAVT